MELFVLYEKFSVFAVVLTKQQNGITSNVEIIPFFCINLLPGILLFAKSGDSHPWINTTQFISFIKGIKRPNSDKFKAGFSPALLCSYFRSSGPLLMIMSPAISVVKCRYLHFTTELGGDIVISERGAGAEVVQFSNTYKAEQGKLKALFLFCCKRIYNMTCRTGKQEIPTACKVQCQKHIITKTTSVEIEYYENDGCVYSINLKPTT